MGFFVVAAVVAGFYVFYIARLRKKVDKKDVEHTLTTVTTLVAILAFCFSVYQGVSGLNSKAVSAGDVYNIEVGDGGKVFVINNGSEELQASAAVPGSDAALSPNLDITVEVQNEGASEWSHTVAAKSGGVVGFRIQFKNTGDTALENVIIRNILPASMVYVEGSTQVFNDNNPDGVYVRDGLVSDSGINIGYYASGADAYLYFSATVFPPKGLVQGSVILRNLIQANCGYTSKQTYADIAITVN